MFNITELTCRICLEERDILINIYDELEELNTNLGKLLETCAGLQINRNDISPKYLCEDCTRELLITSTFREKCDKSNEILQVILQNSKVSENEDPSNSGVLEEYCTEDVDNKEIDDLIIEDPTTDDEDGTGWLIGEMEKIDPSPVLYALNEAIIDPLKAIELPTQSTTQEDIIGSPLLLEESNDAHAIDMISESTISMIVPKSLSATSKKNCKFKCDDCGAIFKLAVNLQKHFQKAHDTIIHCYTCNKCEHCFSLETSFYKHVEECTYLETIGEKSEIKKVKDDKILIGTTKESSHDRKCVYCQRDFSTPFALRMHLRMHTGERPFRCKYCSKSFKTQSQLNIHHKRHTGQADFVCSVCNKTFYEQSNLTVHMRSHTGERPHVCAICSKTFTRVFLLQFHMRTHTGEKPFSCNYCDKSYRQHSDLRSHLATHTGQKQHACLFCGKAYIKRSHLVQHMRKHPVDVNSADFSESVEYENGYSAVEMRTATKNIQNI